MENLADPVTISREELSSFVGNTALLVVGRLREKNLVRFQN